MATERLPLPWELNWSKFGPWLKQTFGPQPDPTGFEADWLERAKQGVLENPIGSVLGAQGGGGMLTGARQLPQGALGAWFGIKRHPTYYHGTGSRDAAKNILERGFTQGESAELGLGGTSVSRDPMVSLQGFAGNDPGGVVRAIPKLPPGEVANLSPGKYAAGEVPEASLYNKPQSFYHEAETFGLREGTDVPLIPQHLPRAEQLRLSKMHEEINAATATVSNLGDINVQSRAVARGAWPKDPGAPRGFVPKYTGSPLNQLNEALNVLKGYKGQGVRGIHKAMARIEISGGAEQLFPQLDIDQIRQLNRATERGLSSRAATSEVGSQLSEWADAQKRMREGPPLGSDGRQVMQDRIEDAKSGIASMMNSYEGHAIPVTPDMISLDRAQKFMDRMYRKQTRTRNDFVNLVQDLARGRK